MKQVSQSVLLPYTAEQVFDVVNDVASYSEFLPWCEQSEVLEESATTMIGRLTIARAGLRQQFTTKNTLERPNSIRLSLVDGPFSQFAGRWQFTALGDDGCKAEMNLKFDFNSSLANMALGRVFEEAVDRLVDAFSERAAKLYG